MKKLVSLLMVCVLAATMSVTSFAAGKGNDKRENCNSYSHSYSHSNSHSHSSSNAKAIAKMEKEVAKANMKIERLVAYAQKTTRDDVEWLLAEVDEIVAGVRKQAAKCGVEIRCEYTAYEIDGRIVLIDPLFVIHL